MTIPGLDFAPLPTHVTHQQILDACTVLGIDPERTRGITIQLGIGSITVLGFPHRNGRKFLVGNHIATDTVTIPVADKPCTGCAEQHTYAAGCELANVGRLQREDDTLGSWRRHADKATTWAMWSIAAMGASYLVYLAVATVVPLASICGR